MRSRIFWKIRSGQSPRAPWSAGLSFLFLATIGAAPEKALAQDETSVLLCDLTATVKLKKFKKQFSTVSDDFAGLWANTRDGDKRDECKRYFQADTDKRLSKLVELGQKGGASYVVASAAGTAGRDVEFSFWLVDVAAEKRVSEVNTKVSTKGNQMKNEITEALAESAAKILEALQAELAAKAPAQEAEPEPAPAAEAVVAKAPAGTASTSEAPSEPADESAANSAPTAAAESASAPNEMAGEAAAGAPDAPAPDAVVENGSAPTGTETQTAATQVEPAGEKSNGLRGTLVGLSSGMIGAGVGGVVGGALLFIAGGQVRAWEVGAQIEKNDRTELNNVLVGVSLLSDVTTIGLAGVGVIGAGILAGTLLFVEE